MSSSSSIENNFTQTVRGSSVFKKCVKFVQQNISKRQFINFYIRAFFDVENIVDKVIYISDFLVTHLVILNHNSVSFLIPSKCYLIFVTIFYIVNILEEKVI